MQRKDIALKQQWTNVQRIDCRRMGIRRLHSSAEHRAIPAPGYHDDTASENEIERPNKSHEENEEEDTLTSGTQIDDSKTRQSRSRNETYRRRLKLDSVDILEVIDRKKSARALKNILRPSPSLHLEQALAEAGDARLLPRQRPRSVHDLSYRDARTLKIYNVNGLKQPTTDDSISLQSITAKEIRRTIELRKGRNGFDQLAMTPADLDSMSAEEDKLITTAEMIVLARAGYDQKDVSAWAKLLLEPHAESASRLLKAPSNTDTVGSTPWFIMNFLLRREHVSAEALRVILDHVWLTLALQERSRLADTSGRIQPPSPNMMMALCVRLVRHARDVWPQALPNITKLFSKYLLDARLQYHKMINKPVSPALLRDLTFKSNRLLSQLSLSGRTYPILTAAHQQRAQFDLIRRMVQCQPPLPINREGHRALAKTLVLQKKTVQERDWASLQARSWPPFKVSRNRLDDSKDRKYGTSTAGKAIDFMRAYGYHVMNWDMIAQVYAGWNPDGSPSIQQRAMTPAVPTSSLGEPEIDEVHAAIITATRTVPEAWAAFLKFNSTDAQSRAIYVAMFKKLLMQERAQTRSSGLGGTLDRERIQPGDGTEVSPPPSSPLEAVYIPSEPPSVNELYDSLIERGFPIWGGVMHLLLEKSPSFEFALKVWNGGKFLQVDNESGMKWSTSHLELLRTSERREVDVLPDLPQDLLTSFVCSICAFPRSMADFALIDRSDLVVGSWRLRSNHTLVYAYRLLVNYRLSRTRAWNQLFKAMARRSSFQYAIERHYRTRERFWPLIAWAFSEDVLRSMLAAGARPDHTTFEHLCDIVMEAGLVVRSHSLDQEDTPVLGAEDQADLRKEAAAAMALMARGSTLLRRQFARLVGLENDRTTWEHEAHARMPNYLTVPKAAVLHKYVRALGILCDHEGIYSLLQWMVRAANELHELQDTQLSGRRHMRQLIVSLRVWLECPSRDFVLADRGVVLGPADLDLVQLAQQDVEQVRRWGGWPSDSDVSKYCNRHPSP